ncbi:hypothetical protein B0J14DRAFT_96458 [Halenospora varia]|nr:hypothetical protein B0J14DRAFT_96458 [Halenospora varia]
MIGFHNKADSSPHKAEDRSFLSDNSDSFDINLHYQHDGWQNLQLKTLEFQCLVQSDAAPAPPSSPPQPNQQSWAGYLQETTIDQYQSDSNEVLPGALGDLLDNELLFGSDFSSANNNIDSSLSNWPIFPSSLDGIHTPYTAYPTSLHTAYTSRTFGESIGSHARLEEDSTACIQCKESFDTKGALDAHAKYSQHSPYSCKCGKLFSRCDILDRHIHSMQPTRTYPCPHCKKYRGTKAFSRRDHLTQHIRGYHHIELSSDTENSSSASSPPPSAHQVRKKIVLCPHKDCFDNRNLSLSGRASEYQGTRATFRTKSELTSHLRQVHDESVFPCVETNCDRVGGRGFFRKRDLLKHRKDFHQHVVPIAATPVDQSTHQ